MTRSESPSPSLVPHRKGVLFCPECEYASPFDGDWNVQETAEAVTYHCPACHGLVQRRPVFGPESTAATSPPEPTPRFGVAPKAVENWARAWSSWTTAWVQFVRQTQQ